MPAVFTGGTYAPVPPGIFPTVPPTNDIKNDAIVAPAMTPTPATVASVQVQPMTAPQPNTTPTVSPNPTTFDIDAYRDGTQDTSATSETFNPRTLSMEGNADTNEISSMSLAVPNSNGQGQEDILSFYSRFFLQAVSEAEQEKYQVVETFTGFYAFFFGKRPPIYRYSGTLLADENYRWNNDFKFVYENYFRGSSATALNAEVILIYDGRQVTGFPLGLTMNQDAANDKGIPFAMDVLVVDHTPLNFSVDIASLFARAKAKLSASRSAITSFLKGINANTAGSTSTLAASQATNGVTAASSISLPTSSPASLGPVSQLASGL